MRSLPHTAPALLLLLALALAGGTAGTCAGVEVLSPAEGEVLLSPSALLALRFDPPIEAGERVIVDLEAGLDAPTGAETRDLSDELVIDPISSLAWLPVEDLPPGRSRVVVDRVGGSVDYPPLARELDRGGFFPDAEGPFGAGVVEAVAPQVLGNGERRDLQVFLWYPTREEGEIDPGLNAQRDAPLAAGAEALPAVVFSHGNCGLPEITSWWTARMARAGWLAAAMAHPENTARDPGCNSNPVLIRSFLRRPGDLSAVIDWLLERSGDPDSPFAGAVDPERFALAGHSFGGLTAVRAADSEPRARATLPMAPAYAPVAPILAPTLPLPIPAMVQVGENDTVTPVASDATQLYDALAAPRFLVELLGGGHGVFTNFCDTFRPGECPLGVHENIARFSLGFLGRHAADDLRWEGLLTPAPGVAFSADP